VHAIVVTAGSISPTFFSNSHFENRLQHWDDRLYVPYGIGLGPEFVMSVFSTYLIIDLYVTILQHWSTVPNLLPFVVHHVFAAASWVTGIYLGLTQWYGCIWMLAELSTPTVNLFWMLGKVGKTNGSLFTYNAMLMMLCFFVARVLPIPFTTYFFWEDAAAFHKLHAPYFYWYCFVIVVSASLQLFWFSLMVRGALKKLGSREKAA
jgi:hypothetical protein